MRLGPAALLVSALLAVMPTTAQAATTGQWVDPQVAGSPGSGTGLFMDGVTMGADDQGAVDVAWQQSENSTSAFYVAHRDPRSSWVPEKLEPYGPQDASLAVAPNGTAILAYVDNADHIVVRWRTRGGSWSPATPLTGGSQVGSPRVGI